MKQSYLKSKLVSRELSPKLPVNIHHITSTSRLKSSPLSVPSIVSSVLHIKQKPRKTFKCEILKFKGGGFKGIIQKRDRIRSLLPALHLDFSPQEHFRKEKTQRIKIIKGDSKFMFKTASLKSFTECISGKKLTYRKTKDL